MTARPQLVEAWCRGCERVQTERETGQVIGCQWGFAGAEECRDIMRDRLPAVCRRCRGNPLTCGYRTVEACRSEQRWKG